MASRFAGGVVAVALLAVLLVATTLGVGMLPNPLSAGEQTEPLQSPTEEAGTEQATNDAAETEIAETDQDGTEQAETEIAGTERAETEMAGPSATVTIYDENGTVLGEVDASVADDRGERFDGLSPYDSLANGSGKLFVYDEEGRHAYVMRKMDFPLDIVYIGADERINQIHDAPLPPEDTSDLKRYRGEGQWVLEVPNGWMDAKGIAQGDRVEIEYHESSTNITTNPGNE